MKALRIKVTGRVQGVFYRASTKTTADHLGIYGWVQNQPDGSVLIHAQGEGDSLEKLVSWCKEGPAHAEVSELICSDADVKDYGSFEIKQW